MADGNAEQQEFDEFQDPLADYEPKSYTDPLQRALAEERVSAIRSQPFMAVPPDTPIHRAVQTLAGLEIACLLVEDDEKLVGIFTERDVLDRVALEYDSLKDRPVKEVMTTEPVYLYESDSAAAALCIMAITGYRHAPVLDLNDRIVGVVGPQRIYAFLKGRLGKD